MLDVYDVYARNHDSFRSVCESLHFEETWRASDWIMIVWFDELLSGRWCCQVIQMLWCATHGFSRGEAWKADEMSEMLWTYRRLKNLAACTKMILNVSKCIEMYPNVSKRTISCFESAWSALDVAEVNFPIEITYDEKKFSFQVMRFGSQIPMVYPEKIKRQLDLAKLLSCVVAADFSSENYQLFQFFFPRKFSSGASAVRTRADTFSFTINGKTLKAKARWWLWTVAGCGCCVYGKTEVLKPTVAW